jgi:hypothetical protein
MYLLKRDEARGSVDAWNPRVDVEWLVLPVTVDLVLLECKWGRPRRRLRSESAGHRRGVADGHHGLVSRGGPDSRGGMNRHGVKTKERLLVSFDGCRAVRNCNC